MSDVGESAESCDFRLFALNKEDTIWDDAENDW